MMEQLLTPVRTTATSHLELAENQLVPVSSSSKPQINLEHDLKTPQGVLEALHSSPDHRLLTRSLRWLDATVGQQHGFNIKVPGPKAAEIIFTLVGDTIPNYWRVLKTDRSTGESKQQKLITRCLSSVAGIGAIMTRLRVLLDPKEETQDRNVAREDKNCTLIEDLIDVLENILIKDIFIMSIWKDVNSSILSIPQRVLLWKDFVQAVVAGRLLSLAAEADHALNRSSLRIQEGSWLANGSQYCNWLGKNIAYMVTAIEDNEQEAQKAVAQVLGKALKLGHNGERRPGLLVNLF